LKLWLIQQVLLPHLKDNTQSRLLQPDGSYRRVAPAHGEPPFNVQEWFLNGE
jgi:polyphosphate kinase